MGAGHLCAFLKSHGHDTHVIDFNLGYGIPMTHEGADWWDPAFAEKFFSEKPEIKKKILDAILACKPDLVGFCAFKACAASTVCFAKELKRLHKAPFILIGGPHACRMPRSPDYADAIMPGESELALLDLIELMQGRRPWGPIPGTILLRG